MTWTEWFNKKFAKLGDDSFNSRTDKALYTQCQILCGIADSLDKIIERMDALEDKK